MGHTERRPFIETIRIHGKKQWHSSVRHDISALSSAVLRYLRVAAPRTDVNFPQSHGAPIAAGRSERFDSKYIPREFLACLLMRPSRGPSHARLAIRGAF